MKMFQTPNPVTGFLMMGVLVLLGFAPLAQPAWAVRNAENSDVESLLYQVREDAVGLDHDAEFMETFVRSDVDWQGHVPYLIAVKEHVNNMAAALDKLQAAHDTGSPEQQDTIDRITPLLREIARNTNSAILYINQNQSRPLIGDYPTWLRENAEASHELAELISDTIRYGQTMSGLQKLSDNLKAK